MAIAREVLAQELRSARDNRGLSQQTAAERAGLSRTVIAQIELGNRPVSADELAKLVNEGKAAVAFSLYPTTIDDLLRVSDAGEIMPPKSTWFEPKLRDGLLVHEI